MHAANLMEILFACVLVAGGVVLLIRWLNRSRSIRSRQQRLQHRYESLRPGYHQGANDCGLHDRQRLEQDIQSLLLRAAQTSPGTLESHAFSLIYVEVESWPGLRQRITQEESTEILGQLETRLLSITRPGDTLAHIAPAGFAMLVNDPRRSVHQCLLSLVETVLSKPVELNRKRLFLHFGMGASRYPDVDEQSPLAVAMRKNYRFGGKPGGRRPGYNSFGSTART